MEIIKWIVAVFIAVICAFLGGLYINYYVHGKKKLKIENVKKCIKNKKYILYFFASFFIGMLIFTVGVLYGINLLQSFVNMLTILWIMPIVYLDYKYKIIPNIFIIIGLAAWALLFIVKVIFGYRDLINELKFSGFGLLLGGGILLLSYFVSKHGIGMGDVKMYSVIGLIYGFNNTFSILIVTLFAMFVTGIVMLITKKADRKSSLPMAPFTGLALLFCYCIGI